MKLLHARLVEAIDILRNMNIYRTCSDEFLVDGEKMQVYPEIENIKERLHILRGDLHDISLSLSENLVRVPDFSFYKALLPILLGFVNLYVNFSFARFSAALLISPS